jgi:signal transduction histidine kinase
VLELVVKRSRALLEARAAEIALLDGDEFVIAAVAGEGVEGLPGTRISIDESLAGAALKSGRLHRVPEIPQDSFAYRELGARSALVTPMSFRGRPVGFLTVVDRLRGDRPFNEEDERLLEAFAASAAIAVATAQHAGDEALRRSLEASEQERSRWARELHDETLQQLAALRVLLSGALRSGDRDRLETAVGEAVEHLKTGIGDLRSLITDLRPAALDAFGIKPALETLVTRVARQSDLAVDLQVDLAYDDRETEPRHPAEIESTVYRVVQEALTNAVKHAEATRVQVRVSDHAGGVEVVVHDDGKGFDPQQPSAGFGLLGMRERLSLVRGAFDIDSAPGAGTTLRASIRTLRDSARSEHDAHPSPRPARVDSALLDASTEP